MANIIDLVAQNCGLTKKEARKEIESFRDGVLDGSLNPFDDITTFLGIEPDYLEQVLFI